MYLKYYFKYMYFKILPITDDYMTSRLSSANLLKTVSIKAVRSVFIQRPGDENWMELQQFLGRATGIGHLLYRFTAKVWIMRST